MVSGRQVSYSLETDAAWRNELAVTLRVPWDVAGGLGWEDEAFAEQVRGVLRQRAEIERDAAERRARLDEDCERRRAVFLAIGRCVARALRRGRREGREAGNVLAALSEEYGRSRVELCIYLRLWRRSVIPRFRRRRAATILRLAREGRSNGEIGQMVGLSAAHAGRLYREAWRELAATRKADERRSYVYKSAG